MSVMFSLLMVDSGTGGAVSDIIRSYGYQTCDWISNESSHAYIDTGFVPSRDVRLVITPYLTPNLTLVQYFFCAYYHQTGPTITSRLTAQYFGDLNVYNLGGTMKFTHHDAGQWLTLDMNPDGHVYINGSSYSVSRSLPAQTSLILMAYYDNATSITVGNGARLRGKVTIEQAGTSMHLYPCYDMDNENNIGYFDMVSRTFIGKTGTGNLSKGNDFEYNE